MTVRESLFIAVLVFLVRAVCGQGVTALRLDETYSFTLQSGAPQSFAYELSPLLPATEQAVRLMVRSDDAQMNHPLLVTVRQPRGVTSWSLPYVESGFSYPSVERTLCPLLNMEDPATPPVIMVDVSTSSPSNLTLILHASLVQGFSLRLNESVTLSASPSGPAYYVFEYPPNHTAVRVKFTSEGETASVCAIASIQQTFCPVVELLDNPDHRGMFQTMKSIAAINTRLSSNTSSGRVFDFFYVVVTVFPSNDGCRTPQQGSTESLVTLANADNYNPTPYNATGREKNVTIIVQPALPASGYVVPIIVSMVVYTSFYIIALTSILIWDWWKFYRHPIMKHMKHMLADQEAGGSSNQPGNLSSHSGGDDDPDEPDGTTRQTSMQNRLPKRPNPFSVLLGRHWNGIFDQVSSTTSPASPSHNPPLNRQSSLDITRLRRTISGPHHNSTSGTAHLRHSQSVDVTMRRTLSDGVGAEKTDGVTVVELEEGGGDEGGLVPSSPERPENAPAARPTRNQMEGSQRLTDMEEEREEREIEENYKYDSKPLPVNLLMSELEFDDSPAAQREYNRLFWYLLAVIIFYGIPAYQLVLTAQQLLNVSGNQDICYHNSLCSHPVWSADPSNTFVAFNNIISNVGYLVLGVLLILLAYRRSIIYRASSDPYNNPSETTKHERVGIPQYFGIYYAVGLTLVAEAFMSAAYHICPSSANYQFDTTYMFVLAGLGLYKLAQSRCPDLVPRVHVMLIIVAFIILLVVVGVRSSHSVIFYSIYSAIHIIITLVATVEAYYRWDVYRPQDIKDWFHMIKSNPCPPKQKPKYVMVIVVNVINLGLAVCATVWRPLDFSTYFLGVMIINFLLALSYYVTAKCIYKERPSCREIPSLKGFQTIRPVVYFLLSLAFWGCGIVFYLQSVTNWLQSPADSRNRNEECILLGFYDSHDIWHFASAFALFFSALMVMSLDDGQEFDVRTKLRVF